MKSNPFRQSDIAASKPPSSPAALPARYRWMILACSLSAFSVSLFLAWSTLKVGSILGCDHEGVFDCGHVLQTRWSKFFGIPVSLPAAALHLTLLTLLVASAFRLPSRLRLSADFGIFLCAMCAGAAALWFVGLQVFAIGKLCKYCLIAHGAGIAACLIALIGCGFRFEHFAKPAAIALALTAILAVGQAVGPVPETALIESHDMVESELEEFESFDMDFGDLEAVDAPDELVTPEMAVGVAAEGVPARSRRRSAGGQALAPAGSSCGHILRDREYRRVGRQKHADSNSHARGGQGVERSADSFADARSATIFGRRTNAPSHKNRARSPIRALAQNSRSPTGRWSVQPQRPWSWSSSLITPVTIAER